jgi:hypothetical protein
VPPVVRQSRALRIELVRRGRRATLVPPSTAAHAVHGNALERRDGRRRVASAGRAARNDLQHAITRPKRGFETSLPVPQGGFAAAVALGAHGRVPRPVENTIRI